MDNSYQRFQKDDLILRDELAIDRTLLANERTLLAYLRGGITLLLAGLTFIYLSPHGWFSILGWVCLPTGVAVLVFGARRYRRMDRAIAVLRAREKTVPPPAPPPAG
jgi:putative membrane protein